MKQQVQQARTIFRAVGGNSHRSIFEAYEIIPYLCIRETPRYYFTSRDGKVERQNKRITSNSQWFNTPREAANCLIERIRNEMLKIDSSIRAIDFQQKNCVYDVLFVGKFSRGRFTLTIYDLDTKTNKAWRVVKDNGKVKYFYFHEWQPHNLTRPYEKWIDENIGSVALAMKRYEADRVKYLADAAQKIEDFPRLWERKRDVIG